MGLLSPAAVDTLLLEKLKLLLGAALSNPRRRGPATTYEQFVEALDVRDEASRRVIEVLLFETTTRRPPKPSGDAPVASTSTSTSSSRRRGREDGGAFDFSAFRRQQTTRNVLAFSDSDSSEESEFDLALAAESAPRRLRRNRVPEALAGRRAGGADERSPASMLHQRQIDELFGYADPLPSFSQVVADLSSSQIDSSATPSASSSNTPAAIPTLTFPEHPTFAELWSILIEDEFPSSRITTFRSFLDALNSSSFSTTLLVAEDMNALLAELTRRDPAIPIRVRNVIWRRLAGRSPGEIARANLAAGLDALGRPVARARSPSPVAERWAPRAVEAAAAAAEQPQQEGIWRASFVEHLDDGSEVERPVALGDGAGAEEGQPRDALSFFEFSRRRRADRRVAEEEGGAGEPSGSGSGSGAMDVDSPAASGSGNDGVDTPAITVTDTNTTPATSVQGLSPPSTANDCPSPPLPSASSAPLPPPRTSASIAEEHFRAQRRIARLPSPSSASSASTAPGGSGSTRRRAEGDGGANPSLSAVVTALQRQRARARLQAEQRAAIEAGEVHVI
ncbi:hypothetical protein JCM8097_009291 [Rhodosporidiobolus ruineniae]